MRKNNGFGGRGQCDKVTGLVVVINEVKMTDFVVVVNVVKVTGLEVVVNEEKQRLWW